MKVYVITLKECDYDEYDGFVVVAESAREAIKSLKKEYPETDSLDSDCQWSKGYKIKEIKPDSYDRTKIILTSFNAG